MKSLRGMLPAVVTPLDADGRFAPGPFERLLERVYGAGGQVVVHVGAASPAEAIDLAERLAGRV